MVLNTDKKMEESEIQKFYKNTNVFITGGTGFMGKILIDKLLRSTEVTTIYVLVREKKGKNALSRVDELFDDQIFDRLKTENPKFKNRIEAIAGDCSVSGLGISIMDRQKLMLNIDIVFHVAATVNFDEQLQLAYNINVNGAKEVVELAKQMKNLKSIMHVSTAYSNCPRKEIDEKFYDHPLSYEDVGSLLEKMTKSEVEKLTPRILGQWPNTYTFTKALAESMIKNTAHGLPMGVFRPSIVISTYQEPIQGWINNLYGPTGVTAANISGVMRVMRADRNAVADVIPVDTCVAGLIAAAWDVANKDCERTTENLPIYNYVSSVENPVTWNEFVLINLLHSYKYPLLKSVWTTFIILTSNSTLYLIYTFLFHLIPAFFMDAGLMICGQKTRMIKMYRKIHKFTEIITYFSLRSWKFSNKNSANLWQKMNKTDQELFPFSMKTVHWMIYFRKYIEGIRLYLLKDPESTLEEARTRQRRMNIINTVLKVVFLVFMANMLSNMYSRATSLIFS